MSERDKAKAQTNPRTARVREIVLTEGVQLLASEGGEAVTAARIAERSGVARSTIYRHWPSQPSLLLDVVEHGVAPHQTTELTGDLEGDLVTALEGLRARMRRRPFRLVFATLLNGANRDDAFVKPQRGLLKGVLLPVREVLVDAIARDELPALDVDVACVQLAGPLLAQHVMLRAPITDALITSGVRSFLAAVS